MEQYLPIYKNSKENLAVTSGKIVQNTLYIQFRGVNALSFFRNFQTFFTIIDVIFILFLIPIEAGAETYDDDTSLDFIWEAASGDVDHYNVYVSIDGGEYDLVGTTSETAYTVTGSDGHIYRVKVEAVDAAGNVGLMSEESDLVICDTPTKTWDGGGGDGSMSTAANWDGDSLPAAGDDIVIEYTGTQDAIIVDSGLAAVLADISSLVINVSVNDNEDTSLTINTAINTREGVTINIQGAGDLTITGASALTVGTTLDINHAGSTGTLGFGGTGETSVTGAITVDTSANNAAGNITINRSGAWAAGSTTALTATGAGSITMTLGVASIFDGDVTLTAGAGAGNVTLNLGTTNQDFNGALVLADPGGGTGVPTLDLGSGSHTLAGSLTNVTDGVLEASTSTVVLDGSNQTISGSTTFHALKKSVTETDTLYFDHNSTQTTTGSLDFQGAADKLLHLRSAQDGEAFRITYSGEDSKLSLSYLNVKDADASSGKTLKALSSVDAGNNSSWSFSEIISVYIKAWLEGPYDVVSHSMKTTLRDNSWIPNQSPYDADPIVVDSIPSNIADWILVELRETADGSAVSSKSMFLESDGDIIDTTGAAPEFPYLNVGDYFVVVLHRNHLAIMSKLAHTFVAKGGSLSTIDLRNFENVYGGENSVKELETGAWGLYTGDADGNGQIQTTDKNKYWRPQAGLSGYRSGDFNMDGQVQTIDKNKYWRPNAGKGTQVPQ